DFAEASDLADEHPDVVRELDNLWWAEAGRNHVLPMGDWLDRAAGDVAKAFAPPPHAMPAQKGVFPGAGPLADEAVPSLNFGGRVEADVDVPDDGGHGVLCAQGNWTGGWALVVRDGCLTYLLNSLGNPIKVVAGERLPGGRHRVAVEYRR